MYLEHFALKEKPFGLTPDTQFFCDLPSHQEALNVLLIALQNNEGFIKITGDVGTGKTMLCRKLLNELDEQLFLTAYIPNPHLTAAGLRMAIADEFAITCARNAGQSRMLAQINDFLINAARSGKRPVLIIDEAQSMPLETLEALRLLTNLETEKHKLLQIVLFGQPELDQLLNKQSIRQLRQRISFSYRLKTLNDHDVAVYLKHRLGIAGITGQLIFSVPATKALHYYSRGIPRLINILAHKSLLAAFGNGSSTVGLRQVQRAAMDTEDTRRMLHFYGLRRLYRLLLLTSLSFWLWLQWGYLS